MTKKLKKSDEPEVKSKKKSAAPQERETSRMTELLEIADGLDKLAKISSVTFGSERRMDTGLLCVNLMTGGGIAPGMYTWLGQEQSAKTTLALTMLAASIDQKVDMRVLWDAEGSSSSSTDYIANIFDTVGVKNATVENVFGVRGSKGWTVPPMVHMKDEALGDTFFNWVHGLAKNLPDKRFQDDKWWYVYDDSKDVMKLKAKLEKHGLKIDRTMTAANNGIWVPAEDGRLQAVVLLDSWPSLIPPSQDEEEGDNSLAVQARFFSKQLPRVKGYLRAKRIALLGVNQLRLAPMVRYGNPETEPGGQALKFWSDCRLRLHASALSSAPFNPKGEGMIETEPSVTGEGVDTYRYISMKTIKNKLSVPNRKTWLRLWVSDSEGEGRGYDPVFDTYYYLYQTGQVKGKKAQMTLNIVGLGEAQRTISWLEFKTLILGTKEQQEPIWAKMKLKPVNLRKGCSNQSRNGKAEDLYIAHMKVAAQLEKEAKKAMKIEQED